MHRVMGYTMKFSARRIIVMLLAAYLIFLLAKKNGWGAVSFLSGTFLFIVGGIFIIGIVLVVLLVVLLIFFSRKNMRVFRGFNAHRPGSKSHHSGSGAVWGKSSRGSQAKDGSVIDVDFKVKDEKS